MPENDEKDRITEVKIFQENIKETLKEADHVTKLAQKEIEENKTICVEVDKVKDILRKDQIILGTLSDDIVTQIPESQWAQISGYFNRIDNYSRGLYNVRRDMEAGASQSGGFRTVINTISAANSTASGSAANVFQEASRGYPEMHEVISSIEFEKTWIDDIYLIKQELKGLMPKVVKDFESVVADMSGTGDSDLKYKALLSLRSIIFNQILDTMASESSYSQTKWFKMSPQGPWRKKRFCQAKFFMLENRDESSFPSSMIFSVNTTARDLQNHFDQMSELGKKGASGVSVDNCYKETLSAFANVLRLRSQLGVMSP
jgi:regulator of replication initiation timing